MNRNISIVIVLVVLFTIDTESRPNNLLDAYFKHRAAHNSINNNDRLLKTSGRNLIDPDYETVDAREPGSFVKLREEKAWLGLSQPVSPHRDEMRASSMIQHLHGYSKRLAGHIARAAV
uniref:RxLR effector protein n=1 Tax=Caenorhabditis tropicalis TaxID=1561998 RepID=A0A1I7UDF6_9PELO